MSRHRTVTGQLELPENWKWVPLGEILTNIIGGGTPSKNNPSYWQGKIPWLTIKDMRTRRPIDSIDHISETAVKESSTNIIPADTVIIATRVGLGKVIRVPYDATINQDLKALFPKDGIDKSYLEYWIVSIADYLESIGSGTTVKGIRLETLREIPFPLAPPEDQQRIVAEIEKQFSRLDEAVASLKRIQSNLKRYKAAVLKAAVEGKLTEQWRKDHPDVEPADQLLKRILAERRAKWEAEELAKMKAKGSVGAKHASPDSWKKKYKEPAGLDTSNLPELPEGWVWASIEQHAILVTDGDHNPPKRTVSGIPHLTAKHVRNWRLDPSDCTYISKDDAVKVFKRYSPLAGDLIVTCVGTVGRTAIVPEGFEFSPDRNLAAVRLLPRSVNTKYVQIFLESPDIQKILKTSSGSTAQPHLYLSDLRSVSISLPPLVEQNEVVAEVDRRLSVTEEIEATIETNLKRAERLRQTILQQAFSGDLISPRI